VRLAITIVIAILGAVAVFELANIDIGTAAGSALFVLIAAGVGGLVEGVRFLLDARRRP
jgi:hypothetical protein